MLAVLALIGVTAVWGVTFVQVKDAVELYPLFAFLAVRFAIASATLAVPAARRLLTLGPRGFLTGAALGLLLVAGYGLQTAGLERTTVSSTGFITGLFVVFTPLLALVLLRVTPGRAVWTGVALSTLGLALLSGVEAGSPAGDLLVLGGSVAYSLQIVLLERFARSFDALAFTEVEMLAACGGFVLLAVASGQIELPRGSTVWAALLVTGIFASALAFLIQTWAQRRTSATRSALAFAMEPVFAALFGYTIAGDRLGALGWTGCALIMSGILLAEPAAGRALRRAIGRSPAPARRRGRSGLPDACP